MVAFSFNVLLYKRNTAVRDAVVNCKARAFMRKSIVGIHVLYVVCIHIYIRIYIYIYFLDGSKAFSCGYSLVQSIIIFEVSFFEEVSRALCDRVANGYFNVSPRKVQIRDSIFATGRLKTTTSFVPIEEDYYSLTK